MGTGKTHLATAIGVEACKKGFSVKFLSHCSTGKPAGRSQEGR
nr:ATP-binding protein [Thermosediminibacter oceani]